MSMNAAFKKTGTSGELLQLHSAIGKANGNPRLLWPILAGDKEIALLAMRALLGSNLVLVPMPVSEMVKTPIIDMKVKRESRETRRAADRAVAAETVKYVTQKIIARAFDTFRLLDGSLLRDRQWSELTQLQNEGQYQAALAKAIFSHCRVTGNPRIGDIINADTFDQIRGSLGGH